MIYLFDGYNVAGYFQLLEMVSSREITLKEARERVIKTILAKPFLQKRGIKIVIVFDRSFGEKARHTGRNDCQIKRISRRGRKAELRFPLTETADDYICRFAQQQQKGGVLVITRDSELRDRLKEVKRVSTRHPDDIFLRITI